MTNIKSELYDALVTAGAPEAQARAVAADYLPAELIAAKADLDKLRGDLKASQAELKKTLTWQLIIAAGIVLGIIVLLQQFG